MEVDANMADIKTDVVSMNGLVSSNIKSEVGSLKSDVTGV